jgi:hypothetical protein
MTLLLDRVIEKAAERIPSWTNHFQQIDQMPQDARFEDDFAGKELAGRRRTYQSRNLQN